MIGRPSEIDYDYGKIIKKSGLETNIKFIGFVKHDDLIKYFLKSKIYVLPSYRESLAQTLMEAMAAKLPVIATNVGGNPEIVNEKNGFLIEPMKVAPLAERISYLLENPKIGEEMGNNGYELVRRRFNFKRMIKEYMEIYSRFL